MGCSSTSFLSKCKHIVFSKQVKQGVSTNFKIGFSKFFIQ